MNEHLPYCDCLGCNMIKQQKEGIKKSNIEYLEIVNDKYSNKIRNFKNEVGLHLLAMQLYENGVRVSDII